MTSAAPRTETPPNVPDLELLRRIGAGGFGEVWLATNRATGRLRAVKLIPLHGHPSDPAGREIVSLAQLEAQLVARHDNLLDIHHVGRTDEHLFYIMDPADDVSGRAASIDPTYRPATLAQRLEQGPLAAADGLKCARQLLAGLAHLHAAGMVHRDVKPANCLFVGRELKLADFGLLTAAHAPPSRLGTVRYMPPDGRMDERADVYAAGLVIYEMLSGLPADAFPRLGDRAAEVCRDPVLAGLNRIALRACQPSPQNRFRDATEMRVAVEQLAPGARSTSRPSRNVVVAIGLGVTLIAALLIGGPLLRDRMTGRDATSSGESSGRGSNGANGASGARSENAGDRDVQASSGARVDMNFITEPFEATIVVDGVELRGPDGRPFVTPCTVPALASGRHRVVFRHADHPPLDAGEIDFSQVREISARW